MKFVTIINGKIPFGKALNVASHLMAGLVATYEGDAEEQMQVINYGGDLERFHASKYPHIMLKAKNSNKLKQLETAIKTHKLHYVTFVNTMTDGTWQQQKERTMATADEQIEYYGVALFGDGAVLRELTKKFSLYT